MKTSLLNIIQILCYISFLVKGQYCPIYQCADFPENNNTCAQRTLNSVKLHACNNPEKNICKIPTEIEEESECTKIAEHQKLPGEYCEKDNECYYVGCKNNKCVGIEVDNFCDEDAECMPGLYCIGKVCKNLQKEDESCEKGRKCRVDAFCNAKTGKCVNYMSLENGEKSFIASMCKSFYSHNGICMEGPKRVGNEKCLENDVCEYMLNNEKYNEMCTCGLSHNSKGYCPKGKGDINLLDVFFGLNNVKVCELYTFGKSIEKLSYTERTIMFIREI